MIMRRINSYQDIRIDTSINYSKFDLLGLGIMPRVAMFHSV